MSASRHFPDSGAMWTSRPANEKQPPNKSAAALIAYYSRAARFIYFRICAVKRGTPSGQLAESIDIEYQDGAVELFAPRYAVDIP